MPRKTRKHSREGMRRGQNSLIFLDLIVYVVLEIFETSVNCLTSYASLWDKFSCEQRQQILCLYFNKFVFTSAQVQLINTYLAC